MLLVERQDVVVEEMNCGDRELGSVETCPGVAGVTVDGSLSVDAPDTFEVAHEEGVDCQE